MPPGGKRSSYEIWVVVVALVLLDILLLLLADAESEDGALVIEPDAELPVGWDEAEPVLVAEVLLAKVP